MLRRPATTITLTSADLEAYEANRQRKMWEKQQQQQAHEAQAFFAQSTNGSGKQREQAGVRPQQRSQKDRIMGGQTTRHESQDQDQGEDVLMDG